jgi:cysteine desulfurase/selenocysteine lyase
MSFSIDQISKLANDLYNADLDQAENHVKSQSSIAVKTDSLTQDHLSQTDISQETLSGDNKSDISHIIDRLSFSYTGLLCDYLENQTLASSTETISPSDLNKNKMVQGPNRYFDVNLIRKDFPILQENIHGKPLIWLDNAATTQKPQIVIDTVNNYYTHLNSNIHRGAHTLAKISTDLYEETRQKMAKFIGAGSDKEIVFVRGATEAINLIANTLGKKYVNQGDEILVSQIEHHSNILPWQVLCRERGATLKVIPINHKGEILLEQYEDLLSHKTKLVAITHVSNSIGTVVPIDAMTKMAHRYGAMVLVDGAQAAPHMAIDVAAIDCDFYVISGHKMFAPTGIGVLYAKYAILENLPPWQVGGGMIEHVTFENVKYAPAPYKFEAGTGHIAGVIGLGAAIDYLNQVGLQNIAIYEHELMEYALQKIASLSGVILIGNPRERAGVISFVMKSVDTGTVGEYLDKWGIALRVGHHCAQPALNFFKVEATIRPSIALYNTRAEIDVFIKAMESISSNHI